MGIDNATKGIKIATPYNPIQNSLFPEYNRFPVLSIAKSPQKEPFLKRKLWQSLKGRIRRRLPAAVAVLHRRQVDTESIDKVGIMKNDKREND
jgi:hypothetical protein